MCLSQVKRGVRNDLPWASKAQHISSKTVKRKDSLVSSCVVSLCCNYDAFCNIHKFISHASQTSTKKLNVLWMETNNVAWLWADEITPTLPSQEWIHGTGPSGVLDVYVTQNAKSRDAESEAVNEFVFVQGAGVCRNSGGKGVDQFLSWERSGTWHFDSSLTV